MKPTVTGKDNAAAHKAAEHGKSAEHTTAEHGKSAAHSQKDTNKGQTTVNRRLVNDAGDEKFVSQQDWKANHKTYEAEGWRRGDEKETSTETTTPAPVPTPVG